MNRSAARAILLCLHALFWIACFYVFRKTFGTVAIEDVLILDGQRTTTRTELPQDNVNLTLFLCAVVFYINLLVLLPGLLRSRKVGVYLMALFALLVACGTVDYMFSEFQGGYWRPMAYFFFTGISLAYFFTIEYIKSERQKAFIQQEQLKTELQFLRSQINPHFLFNALNNIFYMAQETSNRELIDSLSSLSTMMRYMMSETSTGRVSLRKEAEYVDSYIKIQCLKFSKSDDVRVNFNFSFDKEDYMVAPMLLLPFVENAFKYGVNAAVASNINVNLDANNGTLVFNVSNSNHAALNAGNTEQSGIGLENVRRRLNLLYTNKHTIIIKNEDPFVVSLTLTL